MGAPVVAQDRVVEVLDAEAQAGDPDLPDRLQLGAGQGARLALEGHLLDPVPGDRATQPLDQGAEVLDADVGGRAAAEVDEAGTSPGDRRGRGVELHLGRQGVQVGADLVEVLVGVDPEVAELAALAAERDVQVEAEVGLRLRRCGQRPLRLRQLLLAPERERGIVGDEDAAHSGIAALEAGGGGLGRAAHRRFSAGAKP